MQTQENTLDWMHKTAASAQTQSENHKAAILTSLKAMDEEGTPMDEALAEIQEDLESHNVI